MAKAQARITIQVSDEWLNDPESTGSAEGWKELQQMIEVALAGIPGGVQAKYMKVNFDGWETLETCSNSDIM